MYSNIQTKMQMLQCLLLILALIRTRILQISMISRKQQLLMRMEYREAPHGSAAQVSLYIVVTLRKMFSVLMTRKKLARR